MTMPSAEFQFFAELLKKRSGLALSADKDYLLESRLLPVARLHGCTTVSDLYQTMKTAPKNATINEIVEAMTTNESMFFRDTKPFDYLRETLLPEYKTAGKRVLRFWSAACSTGQEPYSIAMCLLEEAAKLSGMHYDIIGTDLAGKVLNKAKEGIFTQFEVQRGLPIQMLIKHFAQISDMTWQIKDYLRAMVDYRVQNLLDDFTPLGRFDILFCRNVLIYFDEPTRGQIISRFARVLNSGGYLLLGGTESIIDTGKHFSRIEACRGLYKLK